MQNKEKEALFPRLLPMQEKRLELSWYCYHTDLNRARLPIPPFLRTNDILSFFSFSVNHFAQFLLFFLQCCHHLRRGKKSAIFPDFIFSSKISKKACAVF